MSIIGIPIGFYSYLLPGNINLMVVDVYASRNYRLLWLLCGLILLCESLYCWVSLRFLESIKSHTMLYLALEYLSYALLAAMGCWMLLEKTRDPEKQHQHVIYRGVISTIVHPQQIPFWVITGLLVNKVVPLYSNTWVFYSFIAYNTIGAFLTLLFYMILGSKLLSYFKLNVLKINKVMGLVYLLGALYGLVAKVFSS